MYRPKRNADADGTAHNKFVFNPSKLFKEFSGPFDEAKVNEIVSAILEDADRIFTNKCAKISSGHGAKQSSAHR